MKRALALCAVICVAACDSRPAVLDVEGNLQSEVANLPPGGMAVLPERPKVAPGREIQLKAVRKDSTGRVVVQNATWTSSNATVATITATGLLRGVAVGTTTITATAGSLTATVVATVATLAPTGDRPAGAPVASIVVSPSTLALVQGSRGTVAAVLKDANGVVLSDRRIEWSSSNPNVVSVEKGNVSARSAGTVTITATSEGKSATAQVTVSARSVVSISVTPASLTLGAGREARLKATLRDDRGETLGERPVTWASSSAAIASVSSSGVVRGVAAGVATITASAEGKSATAQVTVTSAAPVVPIEIAPAAPRVCVGSSIDMKARVRGAGDNQGVTFTTSNAAVASVTAAGRLTGVSVGTAVITATAGSLSANVTATVCPRP